MIRIAHLTDLHWMVSPNPFRMTLNKRWLGAMNLWIGRRHHFSPTVQAAAVDAVRAAAPDAVVITGDVTALAIPAEFEAAKTGLFPLLSSFPTLIMPGNHDTYTKRAWQERRFEKYFRPWMGLKQHAPVGRMDSGPVTVLSLDPNRPVLQANGIVPPEQLARLSELLHSPELQERAIILAIHYPVLGPSGTPYENRSHGLLNARELLRVLDSAPKKPCLLIHGHKHHGYTTSWTFTDGAVLTTHNPGSSGYVRNDPEHRTAAFNIYGLNESGIQTVERYVWDGSAFTIEPTPYGIASLTPRV